MLYIPSMCYKNLSRFEFLADSDEEPMSPTVIASVTIWPGGPNTYITQVQWFMYQNWSERYLTVFCINRTTNVCYDFIRMRPIRPTTTYAIYKLQPTMALPWYSKNQKSIRNDRWTNWFLSLAELIWQLKNLKSICKGKYLFVCFQNTVVHAV